MRVEVFMEDLEELIVNVEKEYEELHPGETHNLEKIPYVKFLEHFKVKPDWESHISNVESPFMKLLQLDHLFFCKQVISVKKGTQSPPKKGQDS